MSAARWSVQPLDPASPADAARMRDLFAEVFGGEMTQALWNWKYGEGRGRALAAHDRSGRLVGHYGGAGRRVWMRGSACAAVQICDVMVAREERGVLTRSGPFALLTTAFLDAYIGFGKEYLLGFGFPSRRACRIAEHLGLYASVDSVVELHWPGGGAGARLPWWQRLDLIDFDAERDMAALDALWQAQLAGSAQWIVPQRDSGWWRFRLHAHPVHEYRCYLLRHRLSGRPLGAVALRPGPEAWEWMDWIAPVQQVPAMVRAARCAAGTAETRGWFSSSVAALVRTPDSSLHDIGVQVPTSIRGPGPAPDTLQGRWWLTSGDTDFR